VTDVDVTTVSERLFQTSTILQLEIFPSITMAAKLNKAITTQRNSSKQTAYFNTFQNVLSAFAFYRAMHLG